jgi:flagellin FlaB
MSLKYDLVRVRRFLKRQFSFDEDDRAETGIGVLIIFIALVLVAAVAASVLIHTAGILQQRADSTGTTTIRQVSTGIVVDQILGYDGSTPAEAGGVEYVAIFLSDNTGGSSVNLANVSVTLTINGITAVLVYNSSIFASVAQSGTDNLFGNSVWSLLSATHHDSTSYGVLVESDPVNSLTASYPVLSPGDTAAVIFNVTNTFGVNITQNQAVSGQITPEQGAPAVIDFYAPDSFTTRTVTLQ